MAADTPIELDRFHLRQCSSLPHIECRSADLGAPSRGVAPFCQFGSWCHTPPPPAQRSSKWLVAKVVALIRKVAPARWADPVPRNMGRGAHLVALLALALCGPAWAAPVRAAGREALDAENSPGQPNSGGSGGGRDGHAGAASPKLSHPNSTATDGKEPQETIAQVGSIRLGACPASPAPMWRCLRWRAATARRLPTPPALLTPRHGCWVCSQILDEALHEEFKQEEQKQAGVGKQFNVTATSSEVCRAWLVACLPRRLGQRRPACAHACLRQCQRRCSLASAPCLGSSIDSPALGSPDLQATQETVIIISKSKAAAANRTAEAAAAAAGNATDAEAGLAAGDDTSGAGAANATADAASLVGMDVEQDVDRIIDSKDNEYVLSKPNE